MRMAKFELWPDRTPVGFVFTKGEEDFIFLASHSALAGLFRAPRIRGYQVYVGKVSRRRLELSRR
jgi:hypothetical protein